MMMMTQSWKYIFETVSKKELTSKDFCFFVFCLNRHGHMVQLLMLNRYE
jgi:hypothetical protein